MFILHLSQKKKKGGGGGEGGDGIEKEGKTTQI